MKTYRKILIMQTMCASFFTIHFALLAAAGRADAVTGAVLNGVTVVRDIVLLLTAEKRTPRQTAWLAAGFSAIILLMGILTWHSWLSLLMIVAMVLNTVAMSVPDPKNVRIFILLSAPVAFVYDLMNGSIGGSVNEAVSFLSALIALIRFSR